MSPNADLARVPIIIKDLKLRLLLFLQSDCFKILLDDDDGGRSAGMADQYRKAYIPTTTFPELLRQW